MSWCIATLWCLLTAPALRAEVQTWVPFQSHPLVQAQVKGKSGPSAQLKDRKEMAYWVLLLRQKVYKKSYSSGIPQGKKKTDFESFRKVALALMSDLRPEIAAIERLVKLSGNPITQFKTPESLLRAIPQRIEVPEYSLNDSTEVVVATDLYTKEKAGEKPKKVTGKKPKAKKSEDAFSLDQDNKNATFPKLQVSGYRSAHFRYIKAEGNESQFRSLNGLGLLADKLEQRTDITLTSPAESKTKINARFYEFPNQEKELDVNLENGPLKLRGGIFNASFQTGTWAVLNKKIQGLQAEIKREKWGLGLITSQEKSIESGETFKGNNSKGPYRLQKSPIVEGTLILRKNGQPLVSSDFIVDYFLGQITFRDILGPDDLIEANYEEELLFATSGQESKGLSAWAKSGKFEFKIARLSQDAGAASGGSNQTEPKTYECGMALGSTPRCEVGGPFFCPSFSCLALPDSMIVKGSETLEFIIRDDKINDTQCQDFVSDPSTAYRPMTDRAYAHGLVDFEVLPGGPALDCVSNIKVAYQIVKPAATNTVTRDYTLSQFEANEPFRLETNFQGSELIYPCGGGVFDNCASDPLKSPDEFDGFANGQPDYEINPATQEVRLLMANPFPNNTSFFRVVYKSQPNSGLAARRFDKQVTDAVLTWQPNEKMKATYELATSTSDIGRKPLKVLGERLKVADQPNCDGPTLGSVNESICKQVNAESVFCTTATNCVLANGNLDSATLSVVVAAPSPVTQQLCRDGDPIPNNCQVVVNTNTGNLVFRTPLPEGITPTASYRFFTCKGILCRLSTANVLPDSVVLYRNDTLNESNRLIPFVDYSVDGDRGLIQLSRPLGTETQTLVATYDYNLAGNFNTIQDGNATNLELSYQHKGIKARFQEISKDTVFAGFGIENNLDTLRRNMEMSWTGTKGLTVDLFDRSIETALDIQKLNVRDQQEQGYTLKWAGNKGIEIGIGSVDRSLVDNLPIRLTDEKTKLNQYTLAAPVGKWLKLSGAIASEAFTSAVAAMDRNTDNWKFSLDAKPSENLSLLARFEENTIDTNSPTLSYSSTNSLRGLEMDYRAFDRLNLGVSMDTQDTSDSRPGQVASQQNTIRYSLAADPFWKFSTLSMEMSQQDNPSSTGGKTRTETMTFLMGISLGKSWQASYTLLDTQLNAPGSSSSQDNGIWSLKYIGLSRLKGSLDYTQSTRSSSGLTGGTSFSGDKWAMRFFYLQSPKTSMSLQLDLDNQNQTGDHQILFDILTRRSETNKLKYSMQFFDTGGDLNRAVYEVGWIKKLTSLLELNTTARYADSASSKFPGNDNKGLLVTTEIKAEFK